MAKQLDVFVTGASSGIGRASAVELASRGHRVFAGARRAPLLDELARSSPGIVALPVDVTDPASVKAAAAQVDDATGGRGVDVVVNAAGYALVGPVEVLSSEAIEHQFATNVFGVLEVTRAFLPRMRERRSGRVINVSSVVGRFVLPGMGAYSASKFALEALSDALRMELADLGVSVVLIEPSWVATDLPAGSLGQSSGFPFAADGYEEWLAKTGAYIAGQMENNAIPPVTVARQIAEAAEAATPRSRYVMPSTSKLLVRFLRALPDKSADRAKRRAVGLGRRARAPGRLTRPRRTGLEREPQLALVEDPLEAPREAAHLEVGDLQAHVGRQQVVAGPQYSAVD
jgi:NAD(P)-dependent dehydrogenase (short-subunit alcohol dehydrogenase family)